MPFPDLGALLRAWQEGCPPGAEMSITISVKRPLPPAFPVSLDPASVPEVGPAATRVDAGQQTAAPGVESAADDMEAPSPEEPPRHRRRIGPTSGRHDSAEPVEVFLPPAAPVETPTVGPAVVPAPSAEAGTAVFEFDTYHEEPAPGAESSSVAVFVASHADGSLVDLEHEVSEDFDLSEMRTAQRAAGPATVVCPYEAYVRLCEFLCAQRRLRVRVASQKVAVSWASVFSAAVRWTWLASGPLPSIGLSEEGYAIVTGSGIATVVHRRLLPEFAQLRPGSFACRAPAQTKKLLAVAGEEAVVISPVPFSASDKRVLGAWFWVAGREAAAAVQQVLEPVLGSGPRTRPVRDCVMPYTFLFGAASSGSEESARASFLRRPDVERSDYVLWLPFVAPGAGNQRIDSLLQAMESAEVDAASVRTAIERSPKLDAREKSCLRRQPWAKLTTPQALLVEQLARYALDNGLSVGICEDRQSRVLRMVGYSADDVAFACCIRNCDVVVPVVPASALPDRRMDSRHSRSAPAAATVQPSATLPLPQASSIPVRKRGRIDGADIVVYLYQDQSNATDGVLFAVTRVDGRAFRMDGLLLEMQPPAASGPSFRRMKSDGDSDLLKRIDSDDGREFYVASRSAFGKVLARLQKEVGDDSVVVEDAGAVAGLHVLCAAPVPHLVAALGHVDRAYPLFGISSKGSVVVQSSAVCIAVACTLCPELSGVRPSTFSRPSLLAAADLISDMGKPAVVVLPPGIRRHGAPLAFAWTPDTPAATDQAERQTVGPFTVGGRVPASVASSILWYTDLFIETPALRRKDDGAAMQNDADLHSFLCRVGAQHTQDLSQNSCLVFLPTAGSGSSSAPQLCYGAFCDSANVKKMVGHLNAKRLRTVSRGESACIQRQRVLAVGYYVGRALEQLVKHADRHHMTVGVYEPTAEDAVYFVGRSGTEIVFVSRVLEFQLHDSRLQGHDLLRSRDPDVQQDVQLEIAEDEEDEMASDGTADVS